MRHHRVEQARSGEAVDYHSYLIRLWRDMSADGADWRASLQDPHTGERRGFASLESLFAYLRAQTTEEGTAQAPDPDPDAG